MSGVRDRLNPERLRHERVQTRVNAITQMFADSSATEEEVFRVLTLTDRLPAKEVTAERLAKMLAQIRELKGSHHVG